MPYIYKIKNNINDKVYIGKTSLTVEARWKQHKEDYLSSTKEHRPLYAAMKKYGVENFSIECIEEVLTDEIACEREKFWIEFFGSFKFGYNATLGGDGKRYADYDLIFALFQKGKTNKEICQITGYTDKTVTKALEQNNVSQKERRIQGGISRQAVAMLNKDTLEIIKIFPSFHEAARYLERPQGKSHISEAAKGKRKTAYGYKWNIIKNQ